MKVTDRTKEQLISKLELLHQRVAQLEASETERMKAEEALKESEEELLTMTASAKDAIISMDDEGKVTFWNEAAEKVFGYSKQDIVGKELHTAIVPQRYWKRYSTGFSKFRETGQGAAVGETLELVGLKKDGAEFPIELSMSAVKRRGRWNAIGIVRDITERKRVEEELRQSEKRYRLIAENATDVIWTWDMNLRYTYVSPSVTRLRGYGVEEVMRQTPQEVLTPASLEVATNVIEQELTLESKEEKDLTRSRTLELELTCKDGSTVWAEVTVTFLRDEDGQPVGILGVTRNITERRQVEEALSRSEERYRTILQDMEDAYFEVDLTGDVTFADDSTCHHLGYSGEELIGMNYRAFTAEEDAKTVYQTFNQVYQTGEPVKSLSLRIVRKDGATGFAEVAVFPLRNREGEIIGFRGVGRDITERRRAEAERTELQQKAQLASRLASIGEMAAGIAHEINNPLTGVVGYAQLLTAKDIPEDIRNDLKTINDGAQRVAGIVKRLLAFARQQKPEREYLDVNEIIATTIRLRAYDSETNNVTIATQLDPALPVTTGDGGQLQQVFLNLIINAETEMKLAHGKGNLLIKTAAIDNTIRISFKDDGPGIAEENLERIFDPFFTTREKGKGTGLGLSVCHGIIAEHGGATYVDSELGKGATFVVELPIVTEKNQLKPDESTAEDSRVAAKARILVVDDEPVILSFLSQVLTEEGYEVEAIDNANDALERIKHQRYSLILLDVKMPRTSGIELYESIGKIAQSLARRVVFITGDVLGSGTMDFLSKTKARYITKPFDAERLKRDINRILTEGA